MALDESKEGDEVYDFDGYQYVIEKDLLSKSAPVKVDFTEIGFKIDTNMDMGESSCGGCGSANGCG